MADETPLKHDYSDRYFLDDKNPKPHRDFQLRNEERIYETLDSPDEIVFFIPPEEVEIKSTLQDLAEFYESMAKSADRRPNLRILAKLSRQMYTIARKYSLGPDDPDDHGFGKDCEFYCSAYEGVVSAGRKLAVYQVDELVEELDTVISGCHADTSSYSLFFDGSESDGWNMLEAKFRWNGRGSLWDYYQKNWRGRRPEERDYFPHQP